MKTCLSLLLLLLGLCQAQPLVGEESVEDVLEDNDDMDISERILISNNRTSEILLEGDLLLPKTRNAMKCFTNSCLWKKSSDGLVTIPYAVSEEYTSAEKAGIVAALQSYHQSTCIRFVPHQNENDHISVQSGGGCYSSLGRTGGMQVLSLSRPGCMNYGIMQHETNHALGFNHEQTRSDRDQYVKIIWENIEPSNAYNFEKKDTNNLDTPYDYSSIMHYGRTAFSINGQDTITPFPNSNVQIGQRTGMTGNDFLRINRLYGC